MGSGTLSLPYYGCFSPFPHGTGSLSVSREYLALPDGPGGFTQDYSCPALLRNTPGISNNRGRGLSPAMAELSRSSPLMQETPKEGPTTPHLRRHKCGLGCSPVARHYWGNHCCFLLLEVLRCFSSLGSPPQTSCWGYPQKGVGCPIRKSAHQRSFAPTRGLSQLITSFIASVSQGIHHAPLLTFCFAGPVASNADGAARTFCRLTFSTPAPHVRISWSSKDRGHADACLSQYVKDRLGKRRHRSACQIPQCGE